MAELLRTDDATGQSAMHEHGDYDAEAGREGTCGVQKGRTTAGAPEAPNASRGPSIWPSWCAIWNEDANATARPRRDDVRADGTLLAKSQARHLPSWKTSTPTRTAPFTL